MTQDGVKVAGELGPEDWLPLVQEAAALQERVHVGLRRQNVVGAFEHADLEPAAVIIRPHRSELAVLGVRGVQAGIAELGHPRGPVARSHDILRTGALRLHEAAVLDVEIEDASVGTAKNGTYVPAVIDADEAFWRVVGLYIAEGHRNLESGSGRRRLFWSFHPTDEDELVEEVAAFWHSTRRQGHRSPRHDRDERQLSARGFSRHGGRTSSVSVRTATSNGFRTRSGTSHSSTSGP